MFLETHVLIALLVPHRHHVGEANDPSPALCLAFHRGAVVLRVQEVSFGQQYEGRAPLLGPLSFCDMVNRKRLLASWPW